MFQKVSTGENRVKTIRVALVVLASTLLVPLSFHGANHIVGAMFSGPYFSAQEQTEYVNLFWAILGSIAIGTVCGRLLGTVLVYLHPKE